MDGMRVSVFRPGSLTEADLSKLPTGKKTLIVGGELNDEDMILLRDWIKKTPIEKSLRTVDLSGVSGISHLPARMFARCRRLREAVLPAVPLALGSQTFAYTPELSFIHTEQITEIDTFDCFAFCESLPGLNFAGLEQAGSFSFRKSVFKDSVSFPKLKLLPPYIFQETTVNGNLLLPEVTCCREDAFFGVSVSGTIDLPNCTELGYGVFNEMRAAESIRLTTDRTILLNARTFPESPGMKNTVLYLHPNKRTVVRNRHWGGVLWKEVLFDEN